MPANHPVMSDAAWQEADIQFKLGAVHLVKDLSGHFVLINLLGQTCVPVDVLGAAQKSCSAPPHWSGPDLIQVSQGVCGTLYETKLHGEGLERDRDIQRAKERE